MDTPYLNDIIKNLEKALKNNKLSGEGKGALAEFKVIKEALRLSDVVGRSEQFYCVSSNALVYGKPCEKWCGDENCKALCKQ